MADQTPDVSEILTRLGRVENENRRVKRIGLGVLVLIGAVLLMGQGLLQPDYRGREVPS